MAQKTVIIQRLNYWKDLYEKYQKAYVALLEGGVKSYTIDDRTLTRFDLDDMWDQMEKIEDKIDELEALLNGQKPRKAFAVVPRDW